MPVAEAHIVTSRAERFLAQLCRHAEAMGGKAAHLHGGNGQARPEVVKVDCAGNEGKITFSRGDCTLRSTSDTLAVRIEADDVDQLTRLQDILTADLERFGRRDDLKVSWEGHDSPGRDIGVVRRSRGTTIALIVAVALAVVAHVVAGGAALAAWRWTSVAADVLVVLVIVKIVAVAVFARHRIRGHGRGRRRDR
ncbi:DUF2218 domain-containing protein [Amycolatopsis sp. RTGN1]|uniref:DUF2218 domain-containing protein n=1 Tax=Amycolatopsis ponsaeliensis TaxID=2992142 RepID=UPI00254A27E9|nr:DUF2218 domain-containing protein [Amycolatopsis sp. RTGN1]